LPDEARDPKDPLNRRHLERQDHHLRRLHRHRVAFFAGTLMRFRRTIIVAHS
jgi:hypothetical protein